MVSSNELFPVEMLILERSAQQPHADTSRSTYMHMCLELKRRVRASMKPACLKPMFSDVWGRHSAGQVLHEDSVPDANVS